MAEVIELTDESQPYDHVVVPLDGSDEMEISVSIGATLAANAGVGLSLVTVTTRGAVVEREEYLARVAAELVDTPVDTAVFVGHPAAQIVEFTHRFSRPLVCLHSHGRGRVGCAVLGSVAMALVGELHSPVLVIGPHVTAGRFEPKRIVVALDGSEQAARILPVASRWAGYFGLAVDVVEVIDPQASEALDDLPRDDVLEGGYVARIAAELGAVGIDATWETLHGTNPAAALCRYAEPYDDVVWAMTTHARAGARLVVLGSVAGAVLHATRHPLLLVKP